MRNQEAINPASMGASVNYPSIVHQIHHLPRGKALKLNAVSLHVSKKKGGGGHSPQLQVKWARKTGEIIYVEPTIITKWPAPGV